MNIPSSEIKKLLTFLQNVSSKTKMWITFHVCCRQIVERSFETLKRLLLADQVDDQKIDKCVNPALWVVQFVSHEATELTPSEMHYLRKPPK